MRYSVTAVVVSYNREELLAECLAGIDRQTRQPDHLIVIDNAKGMDEDELTMLALDAGADVV